MDLGGLYSQTKPFTRQSMVFGDPRARLFGGRGACAATSVLCLPLSCSCGGAFWQGDVVDRFSFGKKNPASDIITRCLYACIHVRTHCHSLTALSLSIFIICRSVCSRIISHTFSGIVWRWGLRGWELGTSQSLAKWNGHYILRFISWCTVSVFGVSRGCKDRAFNTYNGSCQIGLSNAKSWSCISMPIVLMVWFEASLHGR